MGTLRAMGEVVGGLGWGAVGDAVAAVDSLPLVLTLTIFLAFNILKLLGVPNLLIIKENFGDVTRFSGIESADVTRYSGYIAYCFINPHNGYLTVFLHRTKPWRIRANWLLRQTPWSKPAIALPWPSNASCCTPSLRPDERRRGLTRRTS